MSCKSAIYAVNTSTATIPEGGTYQPNTIIRIFGQCCQMANNAMELNGQGYYDVAVTATVIGTVAGNVTMTVYQMLHRPSRLLAIPSRSEQVVSCGYTAERTVRLLLLLSAVRRSPEAILLSTLQSSRRTNVLEM